MVKSSISWWVIVAVICFNGVGPAVNYFARAKYTLLLQAEGKIYILTNIETSIHVLLSVAKIILLMYGCNVVVVQFSAMMFYLLQTTIILFYIKKNYKWIDLTAQPNQEALKQSRNAMVHQVGTLVFNNTDTILLTVFAGLSQVSVYAIYGLLFGMIRTAISTINDSLKFILGQTFNNNIQKFKKINKVYENFFIAIVFGLFTIAAFFITPFLRLYTAGVTDVNYFMPYLPILFTVISILTQIRTPANQTISFAKHYKETQWRCIIETLINLCVSIALVIPFGIYGVLFGTIAALLYRTTDMIIYANKKILKQRFYPTVCKIGTYFMVFFAIQFINKHIVLDLTSYLKIILWCVPYAFLTLTLYLAIAIVLDWKNTKIIFNIVKRKIFARKKQEINK